MAIMTKNAISYKISISRSVKYKFESRTVPVTHNNKGIACASRFNLYFQLTSKLFHVTDKEI